MPIGGQSPVDHPNLGIAAQRALTRQFTVTYRVVWTNADQHVHFWQHDEGWKGMSDRLVTRGFVGRKRSPERRERTPPGQYLTNDFPVLSAGPTPYATGGLDLSLRGSR